MANIITFGDISKKRSSKRKAAQQTNVRSGAKKVKTGVRTLADLPPEPPQQEGDDDEEEDDDDYSPDSKEDADEEDQEEIDIHNMNLDFLRECPTDYDSAGEDDDEEDDRGDDEHANHLPVGKGMVDEKEDYDFETTEVDGKLVKGARTKSDYGTQGKIAAAVRKESKLEQRKLEQRYRVARLELDSLHQQNWGEDEVKGPIMPNDDRGCRWQMILIEEDEDAGAYRAEDIVDRLGGGLYKCRKNGLFFRKYMVTLTDEETKDTRQEERAMTLSAAEVQKFLRQKKQLLTTAKTTRVG